MFSTYQKVEGGDGSLFIGNNAKANVVWKGIVVLKWTSEKELVLTNVLHVLDIRKNLVSGPFLSNKEFKLVFEFDKFVLTKGGMFVGKGYLTEGLFKLNVITISNNNNKNDASAYLTESCNLWHKRLGHINF